MDIASLVDPQNVHYEELLLKDPDNESLWLDYFELVQDDFRKSQFVLHRAVTQLPASTLLWNAYLLLPWTPADNGKLLSLYELALLVLNPTPSLWLRYLALAMDSSPAEAVDFSFNKALMSLDEQYHGPIWTKYLAFADAVRGKLGASIYRRFFAVCDRFSDGPDITADVCILQIARFGEISSTKTLFNQSWEKKYRLSHLLSLVVLEYCKILRSDKNFHNTEYFESVVDKALLSFLDMGPEFHLELASYYVLRKEFEKAHHQFQLGLNSADSVKQMTYLFSAYADFQHNELTQSGLPEEQLMLRLDIYERFLDNLSRLVNDVHLKKNPNNVDYWLDRAQLYEQANDKNQMLSTLVKAITSINPLKTTSTRGKSLVDLWKVYANVYICQNDFETANIIFSKAIKSQFKTPEELAEIYITWTETLLQSYDDNVALENLERVLFADLDDVDYEDSSIWVQRRLHKCTKLWEFYFDLLKSIFQDDNDESILQKWGNAFDRMKSLKIISIRVVLDFADFLQEQKLWERSFSIYETGLSCFNAPQAKYEIYKRYISRVLSYDRSNKEKIRDLFDHCISHHDIPGYLAKSIYEMYSEFEMQNGSIVKSKNIIQQGISHLTSSFNSNTKRYTKRQLNQIADDKFELYKKLLSLTSDLKDADLQREVYSESIQDIHLSFSHVIDLGMEFISFEVKNNELHRVRALFKHLVGLRSPENPIMSTVWQQWETFEVQNGNEASFKDMLRLRRRLIQESTERDTARDELNPMGFVKSLSTGNGSANAKSTEVSDPNAIELDMDV